MKKFASSASINGIQLLQNKLSIVLLLLFPAIANAQVTFGVCETPAELTRRRDNAIARGGDADALTKSMGVAIELAKQKCAASLAKADSEAKERIRISQLKPIEIGMSQTQVVETTAWNLPVKKEKETTQNGVRERWTFSESRYLEFVGGKLALIHE